MPALGQKWFYKTCAGGSRKLATDEHGFSQIRLVLERGEGSYVWDATSRS